MRKIKKKSSAVNLTQGPVLKSILIFSVPLFIGNIFQQLYNVVDSIIVGNYVGAGALAAVGLCSPIILTLFSLFFGVGNGTSVVISQFRGAGDEKNIEKTIRSAYTLVAVGCIPIILAGVLASRHLLMLINVPADIIEDANVYLQIYFLGSFANMGFGINDGILRGLGDSRASLRFLTVACLANIALDLFFVLYMNWAVMGVAAATILAQILAWVMSVIYIQKNYLLCRKKLFRIDKKIFKKICRIGVPMSVQHAVFSLGTIVMQTLINSAGADFIAGFNAASKVDMFAFMPIQSFSVAATAFVGQNIGAGKYERIRKGIVKATKVSILANIVIAGIILLTAVPLLSMFNREPEVLRAGLSYLYRIMPFYFLLAITSMLNATLRGAGDTIVPTFIMIAALWLGRVPAAYLLEHYLGSYNIFFCYGAGWLVEIMLLGIYYRFGKWKKFSRMQKEDMK